MWIAEINNEHNEELRTIALQKGTEDGVDWSDEEINDVKLVAVDERGLHLEEVLCSQRDQRCIALHLPIGWPSGTPISQLPQMRAAYAEIVRVAYQAVTRGSALPPAYGAQQQELDGLMSLMNAQFGKLLKYYALRHASQALSPLEQVERAHLTQLTFEGLLLELTTVDFAEGEGERINRRVWSTSIMFHRPCASTADVEEALIAMFSVDGSREQMQPDASGAWGGQADGYGI